MLTEHSKLIKDNKHDRVHLCLSFLTQRGSTTEIVILGKLYSRDRDVSYTGYLLPLPHEDW